MGRARVGSEEQDGTEVCVMEAAEAGHPDLSRNSAGDRPVGVWEG